MMWTKKMKEDRLSSSVSSSLSSVDTATTNTNKTMPSTLDNQSSSSTPSSSFSSGLFSTSSSSKPAEIQELQSVLPPSLSSLSSSLSSSITFSLGRNSAIGASSLPSRQYHQHYHRQPPVTSSLITSSSRSNNFITNHSLFATFIKLLFFVIISTSLCVQYSNAEVITLQPLPGKAPSISDKEAVLIILPEKGVPHTDYEVFGRLIQQLYPLRLWIELVDVGAGRELTLDNLPLIVTETNRRLKSLASIEKSPDAFLAAHGHYGHLAADYAKAMPNSLRGLILLGGFLPKRMTLASFPLPVLTVAGEVDGVTRITRIAEALGRMISDTKFDPFLVTQSPFVVLEGCNHDVYISGHLPAAMFQMDIQAERERAEAMETAATVTSLFIASTLQEPFEIVKAAEAVFKDSFERAKLLTKPIRDVREMTQDTNFKSYWVKAAQKWLSGLEGRESSYLEVHSYVVDSIRTPLVILFLTQWSLKLGMPVDSYVVDEAGTLALPPALVIEEGIPYVVTFSDVVTSSKNPHQHDDVMHSNDVMGGSMMDEEDTGMSPQAPLEIAARMLGPERIQKFLQNTTIAKNYTCRDLNYCSFMTAYHSSSDAAKRRFDSYERGVVFEPDVVTDSEALWESTKLKIEVRDNTIHVTSIAYLTQQDEALTEYSGLFFCKLLPPDRALEWIYVDSLRRELPEKL